MVLESVRCDKWRTVIGLLTPDSSCLRADWIACSSRLSCLLFSEIATPDNAEDLQLL
jgi:hypothetical protein